MSSTVKIGLIGLGNMGKNHLRNLASMKNVDVEFVYDADFDIAKNMAEKYGVRASDDLESDLGLIDGVVIVTPTSTHFDYIEMASSKVKNIFVEKPLTDSVESSEKVKALALEKGLNIQVGFIERYNAAIFSLKDILSHSDQVINIDFSRTNKVSQRITDVDVIIDLMIHDIDLALNLNGKVKKVDAHGFVKDGMIEFARAIITHENGSFSNIVASRITEKRIRTVCATCNDMYVDCNLFNKQVFVNKQSIEQYMDNVIISSKEETINVRPQEGLLLELTDFARMCRGDSVQVPNVNDALAAISVASEIQKIIQQ